MFRSTGPEHKATLIFLHGFGMTADDMAEMLAVAASRCPFLKIVLPEAPVMPVSAYGKTEHHSWFDYLTDNDGTAEDAVDTGTVRISRVRVQKILWRELKECPVVFLGGMSQGGCLALDIATRDAGVAAVITAVSHRLHCSRARRVLCPWHALSAELDDVFPLSWASPDLESPENTGPKLRHTVVKGADHYLSSGELEPFVTSAVLSALAERVSETSARPRSSYSLSPQRAPRDGESSPAPETPSTPHGGAAGCCSGEASSSAVFFALEGDEED